MIVLRATRLGAYGHFEFAIEVDGRAHATAHDALKAAKILAKLGVESPFALVEHARTWGTVEIVHPAPPMSAS